MKKYLIPMILFILLFSSFDVVLANDNVKSEKFISLISQLYWNRDNNVDAPKEKFLSMYFDAQNTAYEMFGKQKIETIYKKIVDSVGYSENPNDVNDPDGDLAESLINDLVENSNIKINSTYKEDLKGALFLYYFARFTMDTSGI